MEKDKLVEEKGHKEIEKVKIEELNKKIKKEANKKQPKR